MAAKASRLPAAAGKIRRKASRVVLARRPATETEKDAMAEAFLRARGHDLTDAERLTRAGCRAAEPAPERPLSHA